MCRARLSFWACQSKADFSQSRLKGWAPLTANILGRDPGLLPQCPSLIHPSAHPSHLHIPYHPIQPSTPPPKEDFVDFKIAPLFDHTGSPVSRKGTCGRECVQQVSSHRLGEEAPSFEQTWNLVLFQQSSRMKRGPRGSSETRSNTVHYYGAGLGGKAKKVKKKSCIMIQSCARVECLLAMPSKTLVYPSSAPGSG